jgi:hypothetical protein
LWNPQGDPDRKRTIERAIVLQALWQVFDGGRRLDDLADEHVETLASHFRELWKKRKQAGWRPTVSLLEAGLFIQGRNRGAVGGRIHDAFASDLDPSRSRGVGEIMVGLLDYAAVFVRSEAAGDNESPQWCFFQRMRDPIQRYHGKDRDLHQLVLARRAAAWNGFGLDDDEIRRRVGALWSDQVCGDD